MRPNVICKGTSIRGTCEAKERWCASLQGRVNSKVVFSMHSEWSGLWSLANFRYVIIFSGFEKLLRDTRVNLLVVYSNEIHMHDTLVDHMHGL